VSRIQRTSLCNGVVIYAPRGSENERQEEDAVGGCADCISSFSPKPLFRLGLFGISRNLCLRTSSTRSQQKMHSIACILPPEIVCKFYGYIHAPMRLHKLDDFPWHLGQICSSWRSIFHSMTSNFWNELDIDMDKYHDPELVRHHYDVMLLVLRYFLDHTRGQPFSFQFRTRHRRPIEEQETTAHLFELLVAESIRWQEINIQIWESLLPILCKAKHHMPLLSSAQLEVSWGANLKCIHDLFEDVPRLTCFVLASFSNCHQWRINWASLSVLKVTWGSQSNDEILSVLGQAKRLEKLAIYRWLGLGPIVYRDGTTTDLINLPNLKILSICCVELLPLLQTPSLEELYILEGLRNDQSSQIIVTSFLTRSSSQLRCLGVANCPADFLAAILCLTPDLLHLKLDDNKNMATSFNQLAFRPGIAPLACHLRSLTVISHYFSRMEITELAALLASRTERVEATSVVAPVEKLMIITWSRGLDQCNTAVDTLRQQCVEHDVEFTVRRVPDVDWTSYGNISIPDW
jgi:hypothetical protein